MTQHPNCEATYDVDHRDDESGNGITADEFRGTIHRAVERALLLQFAAALAGDLFLDQAGRKIGVDRHLFAWHRIEAEPGRNFGDTPRALRDHHEIDHQQNGKQDDTDQHISAHQQAAKGGNDMAGSQHALAAVLQDQPRRRDVEGQAKQGREQQQRRKTGEFKGFGKEHRHHQDQHRGGDGKREPDVQHHPGQRQDQHRKQQHHADRKPNILRRHIALQAIEHGGARDGGHSAAQAATPASGGGTSMPLSA